MPKGWLVLQCLGRICIRASCHDCHIYELSSAEASNLVVAAKSLLHCSEVFTRQSKRPRRLDRGYVDEHEMILRKIKLIREHEMRELQMACREEKVRSAN